ncbi:MAG: PDGLE domain-containing protein [Candidatus Omnitrophica bacterium]|nr:PDGLE domain-containing protein [Candidatus Omnitrophota bacterium]
MTLIKKLCFGLAALVFLSPLGLIFPACFKACPAWGEWGTGELQKMAGYLPQGLAQMSELWKAPMPDYAFKGWEAKGLAHLSLAYIIAAITGIALIIGIILLLGKIFVKDND